MQTAFQMKAFQPTMIGILPHRVLCVAALLLVVITLERATTLEDGSDIFQVSKDPNETTIIVAGNNTIVTFTVSYVDIEGSFTMKLVPKDTGYFTLTYDQLKEVSNEINGQNISMDVEIGGIKVAISEFDLVAVNEATGESYKIMTHFIKVLRPPTTITSITRWFVTVSVVIMIWLLGITTDIEVIIAIFKRPVPLIVGMFCQFIFMPFAAWSLARLFQIDSASSIGLILDGSCPGGTFSNLFSVLLEVDHVLSITMTAVSTTMALGMMPLNLFIYGRFFIVAGERLETPLFDIFLQLLLLVVPICVGMFVGYKFPKARAFADRYIKRASGIMVVVLLAVDLPFNLYIFDAPWDIYVVAFIFPTLGGAAGFLIAKLTCLSNRKALTVSIETGYQNALLAYTILFLLYPRPEADLAIRMPYLISIFTITDCTILTLVYYLLKKFYWHGIPYADYDGPASRDPEGQNGSTDRTTANNKEGLPVPSVSDQVQDPRGPGNGQANQAFAPTA